MVLQALPGGLQHDGEGGVPPGRGQQVGRPLALLPQRRAAARHPAGEEQSPGGALPEDAGEQGGAGQRGHDQVIDLLRGEGDLGRRQRLLGLGQPEGDAVVAPDHLGLDAEPLRQAGPQGQRPGGVDPGAEGGEDVRERQDRAR